MKFNLNFFFFLKQANESENAVSSRSYLNKEATGTVRHILHIMNYVFLLLKERERRSPPFNHLRMHPFSEGVSALQIYCMKEGVKVCRGRRSLLYHCNYSESIFSGQGCQYSAVQVP